jgi:mono/diheme cytochrome c family protein
VTVRALIVGVLVLCLLAAGVFATLAWRSEIPEISASAPAQHDQATRKRGAELAAIGNCAVCHTAPGGKPLAGGLPIPTPFGTIYSTNITPDADTGIGRWSEAAFARAMNEGVDRKGQHLYPAFPYDHFTLVRDEDNKALYAYLMDRPAVRTETPPNDLRFPFNIRPLLAGWKLLFFRAGAYQPDQSHDEDWNRGAYLVNGLAHCGACHTPRGSFGAEQRDRAFDGGEAEGWTAYALNRNSPSPTAWDRDSLFAYLRNGFHPAHGVARGPMSPVVENLGSVPEQDVRAIAAYMADVFGPPSSEKQRLAAEAEKVGRNGGPEDSRQAGGPVKGSASSDSQTASAGDGSSGGKAIYQAACATCHESGRPLPLGGIDLHYSTGVHGPSSKNLVNVVLGGLPPAESEASPIMPSFATTMSDAQLEALVTYLRTNFTDKGAWDNVAADIRAAREARTAALVRPSPGAGSAPPDPTQRESRP